MEKQITIEPSNYEMGEKIKALSLINDFVGLGFSNRIAFMSIATHYFPKYRESKANSRLSNWFYGKRTTGELNADMEIVLNKLKNE